MRTRRHLNNYMQQRRETLKQKGICVDCQFEKVAPVETGKRPHTLCDNCLQQRRDRAAVARSKHLTLPLPFVEMAGSPSSL
jgi:hypothetical protein